MESNEKDDPSSSTEGGKRVENVKLSKNFNPFVQKLNPTMKQIIMFVLMSISLAPIRCLIAFFFSFFIWVLSYLEVRGSGDKDPDSPVSKPERHEWYTRIICRLGRAMFVCCGFWIDVVGELASPTEAPVIVAAPHSAWIDGLLLAYVQPASVVSKSENQSLFLYGKLLQSTRSLFVSREQRSSRTATIDAIKNRVKAVQSGHPGFNRHLLMFPEGTCTNRSCLITFKPGAFMPGAPVQPVLLKFHNPLDTYSFTFQGQSSGACAWFTFCQPINFVTVEFLPVYKPNPEEVQDSYLYAKNVRDVMAERLGVPTTDHTFEDCRLMMFAESKNYPMSAAVVEFDAVRRALGLSYADLQNLLTRFFQIDRQRHGKISLAELAKHLSLPIIEPVRELFKIYDKDGTDCIDFRDFITGLTFVSEPRESENSWKIIFDLFDADGDGRISEVDLTRLLGQHYGMTDDEIAHLMALIDTDGDGLISFEDLKRMIRKRPEYNGLLFVYRKMRRQSVSETHGGSDSPTGETSDVDDVSSETSSRSKDSSFSQGEEETDERPESDDGNAIKQRHTTGNQSKPEEEVDEKAA